MRILTATVALAVLIAPALATVKIPLAGAYGDCVSFNHPTLESTGYDDRQFSCVPTKVSGKHVTFSCPGAPAPNVKPTIIKATVVENKAAGTVTITGLESDKPVTLKRCP